MKKIVAVVWMAMFSFSGTLLAYGQGYEYDVHIGVNTSGYTDANSQFFYDMTNKFGVNIGFGASYAFRSNVEVLTGANLVMSGGQFGLMNNYMGTDGRQAVLFPEVNVRHVSMEIPAMIGYRINAGKSFRLTPSVGFYGRYGLFSIKDKVFADDGRSSEKWNCYQSYQYDNGSLSAVKRLDIGVAVALRVTYLSHYELTFGYHRGLTDQLQDYGTKQQSLSLTMGYRF